MLFIAMYFIECIESIQHLMHIMDDYENGKLILSGIILFYLFLETLNGMDIVNTFEAFNELVHRIFLKIQTILFYRHNIECFQLYDKTKLTFITLINEITEIFEIKTNSNEHQ